MVQSLDTLRHARICHNENRQEISFFFTFRLQRELATFSSAGKKLKWCPRFSNFRLKVNVS